MAQLIDQHREEVTALCLRAGARRLDVFGSATRADFDPLRSDLDFYVEFDDLPPAKYADAYFALKESLEQLFGRPVDLITEARLENPYFRERVHAERQAVYARWRAEAGTRCKPRTGLPNSCGARRSLSTGPTTCCDRQSSGSSRSSVRP